MFLLSLFEYTPNDLGITENDFNYYQDLLIYSQPIIYFDNKYTTYFDDEFLTIRNYSRNASETKTTKTDVLKIIETIGLKEKLFNTQFFTNMHNKKFKQFLNYYYKKGL